jgi:hypothetical protein
LGIAGLGAVLGGVAWLVKSIWILAGPAQPSLLFEVAPLFFAVTVTSLGLASDGVGTHRRAADRLAWWIGAVLLPAVLLGGVLTVLDERLLELPLAVIAALWIWLGGLLLRQASKPPSR